MTRIAAVLLATGLLAAPAHAAKITPSDASFVLEPHTTRTYALRIKGLGEDKNVLDPCWGGEIVAPGLDYPIGEPDFLSARAPLAPVGPSNLYAGAQCQKIHWDFYDARGHLQPLHDDGPGRRAAIKKRMARRLAGAPFRVRAGVRNVGRDATISVRVRTGALTGRTVLRLHARVFNQS